MNYRLVPIVFLFLLINSILKGQNGYLSSWNSSDSIMIDVNRFHLPLTNNGILANTPTARQSIAGGFYDGKLILFDGGFFLTGKSNGKYWSNAEVSQCRVMDYIPGKEGSSPDDPQNKIYVIRSTDPPFGPSWQNWENAVSQGAAFYDGNNDGVYNPVDLNGNGKWDPNEDRPDLLGDMTAWCVYNDGLPDSLRVFNNVSPLGIEIQQTVFAQKDSAELDNVIFIKYRIINTGTVTDVLDSVYFGSSNDADIGASGSDDLVGCETILNSGYTYHKFGSTDTKWGNNPPAELVTLLQGPPTYIAGITFIDINNNGVYDSGIDSPIDSAFNFNGPLLGKIIFPGALNLKPTSFVHYYGGSSPNNLFEAQNLLHGKEQYGSYIDPCSYLPGQVLGGVDCTKVNPLFMYSGNPITQTGWINVIPMDQQLILSTGPFKLEKNKPVDIIVAYIIGRGTDYLNSITVAKDYADNIIKYYNANFPNSIITEVNESPQRNIDFRVYQNYPNPFNPSTAIKFSLPKAMRVSLSIYNSMGQEVSKLISKDMNAGVYTTEWNASGFASGVYYYRIVAGDFVQTKKLILLK